MGMVQVPTWLEIGWLRHGFSTRAGGVSTVYGTPSLNLGWTKEDDPTSVRENRRRFREVVTGEEGPAAVTLRQVHGTVIVDVRVDSPPLATSDDRATVKGDGLMTGLTEVLLGIQTADCVPVTLVDVERRAVAVLHAGWRGTAAGMAEHGVARMRDVYGSKPGTMLAAIGPSIGPCCYTVGEEVRQAFTARYAYAPTLLADGGRLDLWEANRRQLLEAGLAAKSITVIGECTGCAREAAGERRYFSHRTEQGRTGRMMSVIGVVD